MMRTSNPVLPNNTFSSVGYASDRSDVMTIQGTIFKTALALLLTLSTAGYTWIKFYQAGSNPAAISGYMMVGVLGGLVMALATVFKKEWAPITTPLYALLEGLFIGGISAIMESSFPGIAIQAAGLTFGTLAAMLVLYQSKVIPVTDNLRLGIVAATGGIMIVYLITIVLGFFGVQVPAIYGNGWMGIAFSLFVVGIAALNFILDFDFIEQGARRNAPRYMEWYGAFALLVTLIWLYVEFLRLLSKLRSR